MLSQPEARDILLWFGWGAILGYPTDPRSYLRTSLRDHKPELMKMPRTKRKEILQFVIDEHARRLQSFPWPWLDKSTT